MKTNESSTQSNPAHLLDVKNLSVHFPVGISLLGKAKGMLRAVDGVSFWIDPGETLGLVGESGCGKSTLARAIARLHKPTAGEIWFRGQGVVQQDLAQLEGERLREARRELQMVFQDPYASLDPRMTVERIVAEPLLNYGQKDGLKERVAELLKTVGLDAAALTRYPHEFSGGQRQRIGIARALALGPALVLADEPASALDVSIQAQIINLLRDLQERLRISYLLISHDLSVVSLASRRVAVMYLGEIVELGPTRAIFRSPSHPYTEALIAAIPVPDPRAEQARRRIVLRGDVPSALAKPAGCPFAPRCPYVFERCRSEKPALLEREAGRWVSCHLLEEPARQPRPAVPEWLGRAAH
jgi:oligopeptide/dipeptide ABC transporter ATP-binding protein